MPRRAPATRIDDLVEAAWSVFSSRGYRRTKMSDVAAALGVSPGALYLYVESKDALFHLLFADGPPPELPVPTPKPGETVALVRKRLSQVAALPKLAEALGHDRVEDVRSEAAGILGERYDMSEGNWRLFALVERSALDLPEIADVYYVRGRRRTIDRLAQYITRRVEMGLFRPVPDAHLAARLVVETVTWFAWHRKGDPDSAGIDDSAAKETCIHMLVEMLVA